MANVLINEDTMTDIADAIRAKKGVNTTYKPSEMPSAISSITGSASGTINITQNGVSNVAGYAYANVQVSEGGADNPDHLELGKELVLENGNHNLLPAGTAGSANAVPCYQLTGSVAPVARKTLYANNKGIPVNCYYTSSGVGIITNSCLIEIPTGATSYILTIDKSCQIAERDYIASNGVVQSSNASSAYTDVTANVPVAIQFATGSTHISVAFRVDENNTQYSESNIPKVITIDFVVS